MVVAAVLARSPLIMIVVHHLQNSRSQRILWLLEELGLPYQVKTYKRLKTMAAPAEMKRVHPLGKSPIIEDEGIVIAETGAIIEYLVEKAGGQLGPPADAGDARRYRFFLHYAEGSVMTALLMRMVIGMIPLLGRAGKRMLQPMVDTHLNYIEGELAARPWFAGRALTAADTMMSFPLEFAAKRADGLRGHPATAAWLDAIHARPAYRAALERGGPYMFA
jgi:glutathione S-transferase